MAGAEVECALGVRGPALEEIVQFSQTAQYALRVVAYMTIHPEQAPFRARDLALKTRIPLPYLSKIMRRLVETGLLGSQKGHGGGYTLARPASQTRFADVMLAVDPEMDPTECVFGWDECSASRPCPLHPFWSELKEQYRSWADGHKMGDVRGEK